MGSLIVERCLNKTPVTKYSYGKKPIQVFLSFRKETYQIVSSGEKQVKGALNDNLAVPLSEVKEIRAGKRCKDFEGPEGKKADPEQSFVIFYGNEFRLKTLSIETHAAEDYENWIKGIPFLLKAYPLSYSQKTDVWTLRTFESISNGDLHCLPLTLKINRKVTSGRLQEFVQIQGDHYGGGLDERGFLALINTLLYDPNPKMQIFTDCFDGYPSHLPVDKAVDFLFSPENQVWDVSFDVVSQDMGRPLSHYWIASSHNTYLMGDQFSSESSVEAYARCLRQGCRCIELDVFDGSDGLPVIYHQLTLVPKISFLEVLYTIRDNAFVTSEYPLILSIENHCGVKQQKAMAKKFQEVFGDMLVSRRVGENETCLPSPEQLKRRILVKGKVPDLGNEERSSDASSVTLDDSIIDQSSSLEHVSKTGKMYIQNQSSHWKPYFFALKDNKLSYIEMEKERLESENASAEEPHLRKKWFHGEVPGGGAEGKRRLLEVDHEGCFLVRNSTAFPGEYTIDFLSEHEVRHIRIRSKHDENGQRLFFLDPGTTFDSLYALVTYYRRNPYETTNFRIERFTKAVAPPKTKAHEDEPWFYKDMVREQAEAVLQNIPITGAFLVRYAKGGSRFAITFRYEQMIKHCEVQEDGRLLMVSSKTFESITDMVNYYRKHTFYKDIKLFEPVTEKLYRESQSVQTAGLPVYTHAGYYETSTKTVTVRALHSYTSTAHEHELSFNKDDLIRNVQKHSGGWWKGDLGNERQKWFPRYFVEEMEVLDSPFGALQTGSVDLGRVEVIKNNIPGGENSECPYILNIYGSAVPFRVAVSTKAEAEAWERAINATLKGSTNTVRDGGLWKKREKKIKIAKEFAELIIYTKSISKVVPSSRMSGRIHTSLTSFDEIKADKVMSAEPAFFVWLHQVQLCRIYPQGRRVDSSNLNPVKFWNFGCHMTALNYQTPDKALQLNHGKFRENGNCGYILKPKFMLEGEIFNPNDRNCLHSFGITPLTLKITVIAGRHLFKSERQKGLKGILNPFVEVEVIGAPFDSNKVHTTANVENGLNPYWKQKFEFIILNPELALIRFVVQHEDTFGDPIFISQATYPVRCLRQGYRSVPLKNGFGEELLSSLLIHLTME